MPGIRSDDKAPGERVSRWQVSKEEASLLQVPTTAIHVYEQVREEFVVLEAKGGNVGVGAKALGKGLGMCRGSQDGGQGGGGVRMNWKGPAESRLPSTSL